MGPPAMIFVPLDLQISITLETDAACTDMALIST